MYHPHSWRLAVSDDGVQGKVKYACSEEVPEPVDLQGSGFSVAFDPLDGSSIVDTNFTVGTIFGIWPGDKLTGITGRDQVENFGGNPLWFFWGVRMAQTLLPYPATKF